MVCNKADRLRGFKMTNQYAVYSKNGELSFNCISHIHNFATVVGDTINGAEVVFIGSLEQCEAVVKNSTLKF